MTVRLLAAVLVVAPLAARADDKNAIDNPYKNVKVGDFATYKISTKAAGLDIGGTLTQTVTAKTEKEATVKASGKINFMGMDVAIPEQEQKIDLTKPFDPTQVGGGGGALPQGADFKVEKLKDGKEKLKVADKEYETTWVTYKMKGKAMGQEIDADGKVWIAKDVPMGMVKMEMNMTAAGQKIAVTMELSETGSKKQ